MAGNLLVGLACLGIAAVPLLWAATWWRKLTDEAHRLRVSARWWARWLPWV